MKQARHFFLLLTLVLLSGCVVRGEGDIQQNYVLSIPSLQAQTPALPWHLKVMPVEVASGLDTTRIALVEKNVRLNYLADSRWAEPLPHMLQFLWIQALKQDGLAASVSSDNDGAKADRLIQITASTFNATRNDEGDIVVRVAYEAKIVAPLTHVVLSVETSTAEQKSPSQNMEDVIQSFNKANAQAMQDLLGKLAVDLKG